MNTKKRNTYIAGLVITASAWAPANATLLFVEDFESYSAGTDLNGQGGWSGGAGNFTVVAAGAEFPYTDAGSGSDYGGGNVVRLDGDNVSITTTTGITAPDVTQDVYGSILMHIPATNGLTRSWVGSHSTGHNQVWHEGDSTDDWAVNQDDGSQTSPDERFGGNIDGDVPETFFIVFRHNSDGVDSWDSTSVWINPEFGATPPTPDFTSTVSDDSTTVLNSVYFGGRNQTMYYDEIRYGTTWNDVVTIPEPGTLGLVALPLGALFLMRRRH